MKPVVTIFNMQNEIIHQDGYIGARGNAKVVRERGVLGKTAGLLAAAREHGIPVVYVGSGYNETYDGLNRSVALFADAEPGHRLQVGSWGAQFHADIAPCEGDTVLYRPGIGSFATTVIGSLLPAHPRTATSTSPGCQPGWSWRRRSSSSPTVGTRCPWWRTAVRPRRRRRMPMRSRRWRCSRRSSRPIRSSARSPGPLRQARRRAEIAKP